MKKFIPCFVVFFCILGGVAPARADIYRYIDSQGVMHFTNVPVSSDYVVYIKEKPESLAGGSTDQFDSYIEEASRKYGVDFSLLKAVITVESGFNPQAVSRKGAKGLMQIMPDNFEALEITDPFNPVENIMGGARYLKAMLDRFQGKLPLALAAYNAGPTVVERYNSIPPYSETLNYVDKVTRQYHFYRKQVGF